MIRTRNFLLYVLTLVFLVSAIGFTVAEDTAAVSYRVAEEISFAPQTAGVYGAVAEDKTEDREAYIQAMRQKIAEGRGMIDGAPIVFTSVDTLIQETEAADDHGAPVQWCDIPTRTDDVAAAWFQGPVILENRGMTRAAVQTLPSADGTQATRVLVELSKPTQRASYDTCLPNDIIAVGADGTLIANHETWRYASFGDGVVIGYALDGFPIITGSVDPQLLDSCGGMNAGDGYAYRLHAGSESILGCFAGTPTQFIR